MTNRRLAGFAMARPQASAYATTAALTKIGDIKAPYGTVEAWQRDAYGYYEVIGEVGYIIGMTANTVAACEIRPIEVDNEVAPGGWRETGDERVLRVWNALVGPRGGKAELYRKASMNLQIAGECFLLGSPMEDEFGREAGISWEFISPEELKVENYGRTIKRNMGGYGGQQIVDLDPDAHYIARLWRSDPRFSDRPDCALKHVLPICREVVVLTQVVDAIAKSRLPAGILFVPDEMSFGPYDETEDDSDNTDEIDPFTQELIDHLTAPIEDRTSAASLVPLLMRGPAEFFDKVKLIDIAKELDTLYMELRQEAIHRLATGLDVPPEIMEGKGGLNHWCFDDQTEVLTTEGWKCLDEFEVGDVVLSLNHETGTTEWRPSVDMYVADVVDEPMLSIEGDRHSSLTTMDHRWPTLHRVRENVVDPETGRKTSRVVGQERIWTTSEKLNSNDSLIVGARSSEQPAEQKWSDELVEVAAWLWTEGNIRFRHQRVSPQIGIWQSIKVNPDNVARIRAALTGVFGPALESLTDGEVGRPTGDRREAAWVERIQPGRPDMVEFRLNASAADALVGLFDDPARKVLKLDFIRDLTVAQLELFIDTSIRADGTVLPAGTIHITQSDPDRLAPLELAAILSGRSTHLYETKQNGTMLSISPKTTFTLSRKQLRVVDYTGRIWCPTVPPYHSVLIRRNGKVAFTGQTGYNIDADFISKHVSPLGDMLSEFLTSAYLRPMLVEFEDMSEDEASQYRLLFDPSRITSRTDTGPNARAAYDRTELSRVAYLRESGFDEADAPDYDERKERDLRSLMAAEPIIFGPQVMGMLYPELEGELTLPESSGGNDGGDPGNPTDVPERKNDTGPSSRPVIDNETGQDEPMPRGPSGPRMEETIIDRLATGADAALERALERAGNRVLSKMNGAHVSMKDRFKSTPKTEIISGVSDRELSQLGLTLTDLFAGSWDNLAVRGKGWLRQHFIDQGIDNFTADEKAAMVMNCLLALLEVEAMSAMQRPLRVGPNGLRVPNEMIEQALEQHERIPT